HTEPHDNSSDSNHSPEPYDIGWHQFKNDRHQHQAAEHPCNRADDGTHRNPRTPAKAGDDYDEQHEHQRPVKPGEPYNDPPSHSAALWGGYSLLSVTLFRFCAEPPCH